MIDSVVHRYQLLRLVTYRYSMETFVCFGIIACVVLSGSSAQRPCLTPSGDIGSCISLRRCEPLLKLLASHSPPQNLEIESLAEWRCSIDRFLRVPKVCCPNDIQITSRSEISTELPNPSDVSSHPNFRLINNLYCGPAVSTKMPRGIRTAWDDFPWMALIAYNLNGSDSPVFRCGGTLINERYVLTAAHCVTGLSPGDRLSGVRVGEHNLEEEVDCSHADKVRVYCTKKYQDFAVESVHVHEEYRDVDRRNDIALIRIEGEAVLGPSVVTSCLPVGEATKPRFEKGLVTGWGVTETGIRNKTMLGGTMKIIPNEECARIYENIGLESSHERFCAVGRAEDSCVGDSGGPFQGGGMEQGAHYFQYGVASYGNEDCRTKGTIVYTNVAYYVKWILDTIRD